jgi:hypothetical protein
MTTDAHEHTGHGPDGMGDCPGCETEYWRKLTEQAAANNRARQQRADEAKSVKACLDEAEEKLAYLSAGCLNMTRDELIRKITEVGSARWRYGQWLSERTHAAFQRGVDSTTGDDAS